MIIPDALQVFMLVAAAVAALSFALPAVFFTIIIIVVILALILIACAFFFFFLINRDEIIGLLHPMLESTTPCAEARHSDSR